MTTIEQCIRGGKISSEKSKAKRIQRAEEFQKKCIVCNNDISYDKRRNKFCSHSCAAHFNNIKYPKRKLGENCRCECGEKKRSDSVFCLECRMKKTLDNNLNKTLRDFTYDGPTNTKHSRVRELAHIILERNNITKACKICGFDIVLDVCHIKDIAKFSEDSLIREINSLDNIVYLCPNHHRMLHRHLICRDDIFKAS